MARNRRPTHHGPPIERVDALFSKHGQVVAALAHSLLERAPGERITRVQEFAARLDASVGTVQAGLSYLSSVGAARLEAHGRLGTYVVELDYPLLWMLAMHRPLVGALPLPYSRRFAGLATGLRTQFDRLPLNVELRFMRGAAQRARALAAHQSDWALISRHAAAEHPELEVVLDLGPETYMAGHILLLRGASSTGVCDGMRIGLDRTSADHDFIVRAACRDRQIELVEIDYAQGLQLVVSGVIDATVWSREDVPAEIGDLALIPLEVQVYPELVALGEAVIVVDRGNRAAAAVIRAAISIAELCAIQQDVIGRRRLPAY